MFNPKTPSRRQLLVAERDILDTQPVTGINQCVVGVATLAEHLLDALGVQHAGEPFAAADLGHLVCLPGGGPPAASAAVGPAGEPSRRPPRRHRRDGTPNRQSGTSPKHPAAVTSGSGDQRQR